MSNLVNKWEMLKVSWSKEIPAEIREYYSRGCREFTVNVSQIDDLCTWVKDATSERLFELSEEGKAEVHSLMTTACARAKDVCVTLVNESCRIRTHHSERNMAKILNVTMDEYFKILNQIQLTIFVNSSTYVVDTSLSPSLGSYQSYHICVKPLGEMTNFEFIIENTTMQKVSIELDNQHFSVNVLSSTFLEAGLVISSKLNSIGKRPVFINKCTFERSVIQKSLMVIDTANVTVSSTIFQNLQYPPKFSAFHCNNSFLDINNSLFHESSALPLLQFDACNVTMTDMNISRNRIGHGNLGLGLVTVARSTVAIISSNIEENDGKNYDGGFAPKENIYIWNHQL